MKTQDYLRSAVHSSKDTVSAPPLPSFRRSVGKANPRMKATIIGPEDLSSLNNRLQDQWDDTMRSWDGKALHSQVCVLIISWEELDEDWGGEDEVQFDPKSISLKRPLK